MASTRDLIGVSDNIRWIEDGTEVSFGNDHDSCGSGREWDGSEASHTFPIVDCFSEMIRAIDESLATTTISQESGQQASYERAGVFEPQSSSGDECTGRQSILLPAQTVGTPRKRFSTSSIRILTNWLLSHTQHPYPTVADIESLQKATGLGKKQILGWFSNARRRNKHWLSQPSAPTPQPVDVIRPRPPTPAPRWEPALPLQRWQNSPPEDEAANATAIERAVSSLQANLDEDLHFPLFAASPGPSSASQNSGSSAYSCSSQGSASLTIPKKKRSRMKKARRKGPGTSLVPACHPFQCTFCTETFKTKHNWCRHEKSLHLSLEQWHCSPSGPTAKDSDSETRCVYCGLVDPDQVHLDKHNYAKCCERPTEERTYFRKDHFAQHLRLVHNAEFRAWPMDEWRLNLGGRVQSRCGFCNLSLDTWDERANHLAGHFREGASMAQWKGDWGFGSLVLAMVENSMPPYLIHYEQKSPLPFTTFQGAPNSPTSAFELIQTELDYYLTTEMESSRGIPCNEMLQYEACCVIFESDLAGSASGPSWLRELLLSSEDLTRKAGARPVYGGARSRLTLLKIYGKEDVFDGCKLEASLLDHVKVLLLLDLGVEDVHLQREAEDIVKKTPGALPMFVELLVELIHSSTEWLTPFRIRAGVPRTTCHDSEAQIFISGSPAPAPAPDLQSLVQVSSTQDVFPPSHGAAGGLGMDFIFLNDSNLYRELTRQLYRFVASTMSPLNPDSHIPTDQELQHQARLIMYESGDPWNQTPADNQDWLRDFKRSVNLL